MTTCTQVAVVDSASGKKKRELGGSELSRPVGLAAAPRDELLVASHKGNAVLRYNATTGSFVDVRPCPTTPHPMP